MLAELHDMCVKQRFGLNIVPALDMYAAQSAAARGDLDGAIEQLHGAAGDAFRSGNISNAEAVTGALVETLLARDGLGDVAAAEAAGDRLTAVHPDVGDTPAALVLLRCRALVARARGDEPTYCELVEHYRTMAASFGLEGSMAWAEATP